MNKIAFVLGYTHKTQSLEKMAQGEPPRYMMPAGRMAAAAIQKRLKPETSPVMANSSQLWDKAFGPSTGSSLTNMGSYMIPVVGDARLGYDAVSDFSNMFGKDLSAKQRLGYGLSGGANAIFSAMGLALSPTVVGSTAVTALGRPLIAALSKLKSGKKLVDAMGKGRKALRVARKGLHKELVRKGGAPGRFMFGTNPYKGVKRFGYGAARGGLPMAAWGVGGAMTAPQAPQAPQAPHPLRPPQFKQAMEKEAISVRYLMSKLKNIRPQIKNMGIIVNKKAPPATSRGFPPYNVGAITPAYMDLPKVQPFISTLRKGKGSSADILKNVFDKLPTAKDKEIFGRIIMAHEKAEVQHMTKGIMGQTMSHAHPNVLMRETRMVNKFKKSNPAVFKAFREIRKPERQMYNWSQKLLETNPELLEMAKQTGSIDIHNIWRKALKNYFKGLK